MAALVLLIFFKKKVKQSVKVLSVLLAVAISVVFIGSAMAVAPGRIIEWDGKGAGRVIFDGKLHANKGLTCMTCHTKFFQLKKEAKIRMADHNADVFCFSCHDGIKAFKTEPPNCANCHKK